MTSPHTHIVFQAYGSIAIKQELLFALLTLSRVYPGMALSHATIHIYTDDPHLFDMAAEALPVKYHIITEDLLRQWKGKINFVHRVKIELLKNLTDTENGNILYLDSDILFLKPVDELFAGIDAGKLYMHICEGVVKNESNAIFAKLNKHLATNTIDINGLTVSIPGDIAMWNAGVLGFKHGAFPLDDVLCFTDVVYPKFPKHIVEQFAFSLYMAKHTRHISTASHYILHYWNLKELRPVLQSFFSHFYGATWDEMVQYSRLIDIPAYLQQKANFYENRSLLDKIKKKRWTPDIPDWRLAVQQL